MKINKNIIIGLILSCCIFNKAFTQTPSYLILEDTIGSVKIIDAELNILEWQFLDMKHSFRDTLDFSLPSLEKSYIQWKNEDVVCIRSSCGSPCSYNYVFSLDGKTKVKRFFYTLNFDTKNNIIIHIPKETNDNMLRLENVKTHESILIPRDVCPSSMVFHCIDNIQIEDRKLKIEWAIDFFQNSDLPLEKTVKYINLPEQLFSK